MAATDHQAILLNPFNYIALTQINFQADLPSSPTFASWWTRFQHEHLRYVALLNRHFRAAGFDEGLWRCMSWSRRSILKLCEEEIKATHPDLADKISHLLIKYEKA